MFFNGGFFGDAFTIFPILFFGVILTIIVIVVLKGVSQWSKNNKQPVLIVPAKLISKRTNVSSNMHNSSDSFNNTTTSTTYYLTFEFETGSREEFAVHGEEYGMLMEGDSGKLRFQGTRYLGFER